MQILDQQQFGQMGLSTSHLINKKFDFDKSQVNSFSDAFARIECHYFINNIFLEDDFILKKIKQ